MDIDRNEIDFDNPNFKLNDKLTVIKVLVRSLELRLKGYVWTTNGNKFVYNGKVLAGDIVIQKAIGLLQPYSDEANLITTKVALKFSLQKYRVRTVFNNTLLSEGTSLAHNYSVVMQMFDDTIDNIGDIILGSKELLKGGFVREELKQEGIKNPQW